MPPRAETSRSPLSPTCLPTVRGIVTSIFVRPKAALDTDAARAVLENAYARERFVRVLPAGATPNLGSVRGSNFCDVAAFADERNGTLGCSLRSTTS